MSSKQTINQRIERYRQAQEAALRVRRAGGDIRACARAARRSVKTIENWLISNQRFAAAWRQAQPTTTPDIIAQPQTVRQSDPSAAVPGGTPDADPRTEAMLRETQRGLGDEPRLWRTAAEIAETAELRETISGEDAVAIMEELAGQGSVDRWEFPDSVVYRVAGLGN